MRSARSMRPPLACRPSASALARWYEMSDDTAITANGSTAAVPPRVSPRYHATPPSMIASVRRSTVESKNAPRWLEALAALARAPSSRSGNAAAITSKSPSRKNPAPMATAAATDTTKPAMVRWSGVIFVRVNPTPTGRTYFSTCTRNLPSNTRVRLLVGRGTVVDWIVFDESLDDAAVDGVDEHESALQRRLLRAVAKHSPRRTAAQSAPHLLR